MSLFATVLLILVGLRVAKALRRPAPGGPGSEPLYLFPAARNRALALAHPAGKAHLGAIYGRSNAALPAGDPLRRLEPSLLHVFGLRQGQDAAQIRATLQAQLPQRWFRLGLESLQAGDDPRDAMAFACARVAFALRAAQLLGWLDTGLHWQLQELNAARARECFSGWPDYAAALARGRRQWVAGSRADSLGVAFTVEQALAWTRQRRHPWRKGWNS
ncbi:DUF1266 domain-containing protein [Tahibacter harae]|uniref:DUF1266 domain-containing protein n=1 Tax=Tahibacter harae TaxID=2963937 RepID=A0ABT1QVV5_9GAMM|nr:DUF1266 domain-containing protein [Tahibacter harae]